MRLVNSLGFTILTMCKGKVCEKSRTNKKMSNCDDGNVKKHFAFQVIAGQNKLKIIKILRNGLGMKYDQEVV